MPAIDRYDGPRYKVLRKYLRNHPADPLDVLILSARFGMIRSDRMIYWYDQQMTIEQSRALQPQVAAVLREAIAATANTCLEPDQLLICLGKTYLSALDGVDAQTLELLRSRVTGGSQGEHLARLKAWLWGDVSPVDSPRISLQKSRRARLAGVSVTLTHDEAIAAIRRVLATEATIPAPQVWYATVDGIALPVKWLVSRLTGVPVQAFTTGQARAALTQWDIAAEQRWVPDERTTP